MIEIHLADNRLPLSKERWAQLLNRLPSGQRERILRFRRWQDRQAALIARLMVGFALRERGHPWRMLETWTPGTHGKPRVTADCQFNISHTEGLVICAVGGAEPVGIDCERVRALDLEDFRALFAAEIWREISTSGEREACFFDYWTRFESAVKADGRGLSLPFHALRFEAGWMEVQEPFCPPAPARRSWWIRPVAVGSGYRCHLASGAPEEPVTVRRFELSALPDEQPIAES